MHYQHERNYGCRVSDSWTYRGLKTVVLENDLLRIVILADKGADIYQFVYKPLDVDFFLRPVMVSETGWTHMREAGRQYSRGVGSHQNMVRLI